MSEYLNRLSQLLPTLCVDTSYEQGLLAASGTSGERLLVAGSQESQLFSLLATEEPLLEFGWTPFFPIEAEYGEAISIRVVNRAGEIERFHNTADFRQCCGSRLEELTACTVQLPDPLLKRCSLRFLMLNDTSFRCSMNVPQAAQAASSSSPLMLGAFLRTTRRSATGWRMSAARRTVFPSF